MSHLLQMRGLKRNIIKLRRDDKNVASFTDAWIETISDLWKVATKEVASFTDAWIETVYAYDVSYPD